MSKQRNAHLTEQQFWTWIAETTPAPYASDQHVKNLIALLSKQSLEEIVGFDFWIWKHFCQSHLTDLWCAAYVIRGWCSDDSFDYFREALILLGEGIFKQALEHPDALADHWEAVQDLREEGTLSIAQHAFRLKTGLSHEDWRAVEKSFSHDPLPATEDPFHWSADDEESQRQRVPRLYFKSMLREAAERRENNS
ncbi:DUF4240 domain-containing protein [Deinococcus roseus]|uniref:DUF4240 domain-containing protein n=1 Tax=Deinococcus roseus TaxID=392414 RepID=A0ABQ2D379_9DEIO|nr:DUF4240 domain-containing protein [Deinococcus roseus]GGJ40508.1 hypothetical protein GCM10008938_28210 [Deinococcus roseus]